jgi:hypothetical protein
MNKKDLIRYHEMFDASDVTVDIQETKRANKIRIELTKESGRFNLIIIWLSLKTICEKLEREMGVMEDAEGTH